MVLKKCPSCKNIVSMDSYCCPRCGIDFRARRIRLAVTWLGLLGLVGWWSYRHLVQ